MAKYCVMGMSDDRVYFVVIGEGRERKGSLWCQLRTDMFDDYRILSQYPRNEIRAEVGLENLLRALKSAQGSEKVTFRLTKRIPKGALSIMATKQTAAENQRELIQDIPIMRIDPTDTPEYDIPSNFPDPQVSIYMPDIRRLRTILERLRAMSNQITLRANHIGELFLEVNTDAVNISVLFSNVKYTKINQLPPGVTDRSESFYVCVDSRALASFIAGAHSQQLTTNIVHERSLIILDTEHGTMTYSMPHIM
eukprot:Clim_evm16s51 gene=Clim_evmTU16s51